MQTSKKSSLLILFITSLILSRAMFFFIDDPEGPNLLIVTVIALIVFFLSSTVNLFNFKTSSCKKLFLTIFIQIVIVGAFLVLNSLTDKEKQTSTLQSYRNIEYTIEGKKITLGGEFGYFGNELVTDLNEDGRDDVIFLITQSSGGSGTFYYVVSALNLESGYIGSDGYLLGDRIAPQTTELSQNPKHKNVIVVNYADRGTGEPMTTKPSFGKSTYLKLDIERMQWGIVVPNFEGESR